MPHRRTVLAGFAAALGLPNVALAESPVMSAPDALAGVRDGTLILIDIRTPEEWQETGVAKGAWPLDMRHENFGAWLVAAIERNPGHRVAIICRTGNRSGRLLQVLEANNISGVSDVAEGMAGGPRGTGWIPAGLPTVTAEAAFSAMPKDLTATN